MEPLVQNTAKNILIWMADSADHVSGKTGLTLTITCSKAAGAFNSITPTVTERSYGWYQLALTSSHIDTPGNFALHITGTGADPTDYINDVIGWDPKLLPQPYATLLQSTSAVFVFWVPDATNPIDGKTGLADADFSPIYISKNGGAFSNIAASVTVSEIDYGFYKFTLTSSHTDTVGDLALYITVANNGMVELPFICHVVSPTSGSDPWDVSLPGSYGSGKAGKIVGDNLNATVSSRAPESGGNVAAIKAKTDLLPGSFPDDMADENTSKDILKKIKQVKALLEAT